ncbi:DUF4292 domain-containing protein [Mucilaginibacter sp.]|uniref:DUF4292 domain-containing protein n=1 Tax=Mucilaginibacter sp. TaxID=1882438 RepID=UPI003AFFA5B5
MKRSIQNKIIAVSILLLIVGCRAKKQLVSVNKPLAAAADSSFAKTDNSKTEKIKLIQAQQINFNTFFGKARTHLEIDGKGYDVMMNIRIQKNKQIWVSITAIAGIEVARAVITPDSIKIINKLQSVYLKKPFSYVYQYTGRQINYKTVESIVVGNAVPEFISAEANLTFNGTNTILSGILNELNYQTTLSPGLKVINLKLYNQKAAQKLDVNNSSFIQAEGRILPSVIGINSVSGQNGIKADLHYIKTEFDQQLDVPFNEPKGYTLIN